MPGHARAAIKAMEVRYERLKLKGKLQEAEEFRLIDPEDNSLYKSAQYYNDNVLCVARESVYHFFETVVDDVLEMYSEAGVPVDMIYTGGDEVPEGAWSGSPMCRELMSELPEIEDPKNLQKYFMKRINTVLLDRYLKTGGWEEIALEKDENGNYYVNTDFTGKNVIPYVWNNLDGSQDLAYRMANSGYPLVLCPVTNFYMDLAYSNDPEEPGLYWGGFTDERDPWQIGPYNMLYTITENANGCEIRKEEYEKMARLKAEARENILGLQAQLWHETIRGGDMMEYYLLPKLIGFAERCWAQASAWETIAEQTKRMESTNAEWQNFEYTIYEQELPKLHYLNGGYNYRIPPAGAKIVDGYLHVLPQNQALKVRYTLNGNIPDKNSAIYNEPVEITGKIRLQVIDKTGKTSKVSVIY
jgi:hexosaminidase